NAQIIGELSLSHSLTSALPSGYSKERPFAFVMTLSSGASYFFQAGTEELVNEWVSTCNYWSARLSKEPLTGGVSNMEYGWNQISDLDVAINAAGRNSSRGLIVKEKSHSPNKASQADSQDQEEMMSIMSGNSGHSHKSHKVTICDWNPPVPPLATSRLSEVEQLESLKKHNLFLRRELEKHNQLRRPMIDLFRNRPLNLQKSKLNWEKKSQYLLTEIIKYSTYIDRLEESVRLRREIHLERRANFEEAKE
ncbi:Pleckstrin homology domain-containing protein, partial [Phakopsora pachyrhizi]